MSGPGVGVLMFVAHRAIEQRILVALREAGFDDATMAQGRLFARIGEDGTRLTDLAEMAQVTKQTASFLVDQLERGGYVERVADPRDARARLVRIAPRGRQAQALAAVAEREVYAEWEAHLGARDMARLRTLMERLREVTDPWAALDPTD
ncbi:MarR family winged helix-turn-helix transcriptional regulator [Oryzobacter terrae]|uniref:MarR family winged helix-turn-helix transcriptional regulator n=1 Tax=Oryzobacter terrae TaxID=1620385 RepID=UPI00366B68B7